MLEAMRAGVTECVAEPITRTGARDAVRRLLVERAARARRPGASRSSAPRAASARRTLAVNTAAALARRAEDAGAADRSPRRRTATPRCSSAPSRASRCSTRSRTCTGWTSRSSAGLVEKTKAASTCSALGDAAARVATTEPRVAHAARVAARRYRITVLDVPRTDPAMLDALDPATVIVVVTSQELVGRARRGQPRRRPCGSATAQRACRCVHQPLRQERSGDRAKRRRAGRRRPGHALIPSDYRVAVEAHQRGRPIVLEGQPPGAAFQSLAARPGRHGQGRAPRAPAGVLARLAWRRA